MRLLIIEDETILGRSITRSLEREGYQVAVETSAEAGLETLRSAGTDLILLDLRLPGMSGLEFLRAIREASYKMPVIMMTAHGAVQSAVQAMQLGAYDYIAKPFDLNELKLIVARALDHEKLSRELAYFRQRDRAVAIDGLCLGNSPALQEIKERIARFAALERMQAGGAPPILILGETGTGKSMIARAIHNMSPRAAGPFIDINCPGLPGALLEAEIFGYEKGAFTDAKQTRIGLFEAAEAGTLFLDEIGHLDLSAQSKLLKAIEEKSFRRLGSNAEHRVNVRIIAATSRDLDEAQASGEFRSDLLHRLKVLCLDLPPLRERGDDVLLLAEYFLKHQCEQYRLAPRRLSCAAIDAIREYTWPGNVRELANQIESALLMETGDELMMPHLTKSMSLPSRGEIQSRQGDDFTVSLPQSGIPFRIIEKKILTEALEMNDWNVSRTARFLHLSRDIVRYRINQLQINRQQPRELSDDVATTTDSLQESMPYRFLTPIRMNRS